MKVIYYILLLLLCSGSPMIAEEKDYNAEDLLYAKLIAEDQNPDYYILGKGTAAEFVSNRFYMLRSARWSVRDEKTRPIPFNEAVSTLANFYRDFQKGIQWKLSPPAIELPELKSAPDLNADNSSASWQKALLFTGEYSIGKTVLNEKFQDTQWYIGKFQTSLYIRAVFTDSDICSFSGTSFDEKQKIYLGDSLEIFIRPDKRKNYYYEYLINPQGAYWILRHKASPYGGWDVLESHSNSGLDVTCNIFPEGYSISVKIPLDPVFSQYGSFMLLRVNRNGKEMLQTSSLVPLLYDAHNIYGYISLKKPFPE